MKKKTGLKKGLKVIRMSEHDTKNKSSSFSRAVPMAGFNSAKIVKSNQRKGSFPQRRTDADRSEIRKGVRDLPDIHIGMLLTIHDNSANRDVVREAEKELRKRHNGKVMFEL